MQIPDAAIREQLQRLLASPQLTHAEALMRLLRFVVDETLHGRGEQLKETRLGLEVFGRRPDAYDAAVDPIVRVQMGRLRTRLRAYYEGQGTAVRAELAAAEAARLYAADIREFFRLQARDIPQFDVMHRGIGPDAHTASLFPGEPLIDDHQGIAAALWSEKMKQWRITLLPAVLTAAHSTVMLVVEADKADAAYNIFNEPYDPKKYPGQLGMQSGADISWFFDEAAARRLQE